MLKSLRLALLAVLLAAPAAFAVQPDELLPDPALEARARALSSELRCLVCQNQSIDDSDASLAKDIRVLIRERISKGESNDEVREFPRLALRRFYLAEAAAEAGDLVAVAERAADAWPRRARDFLCDAPHARCDARAERGGGKAPRGDRGRCDAERSGREKPSADLTPPRGAPKT